MERICGVYLISYLGYLYVGSSKNVYKRWNRHKNDLKSQNHHCKFLQRIWNKYGENSLDFRILENVEDYTKLIQREQDWIDFLCPNLNGSKYAIPTKDKKVSLETREKLRISHLGHKQSKETILKKSKCCSGEKCYNAKLSNQDVILIRDMVKQGTKQADIARNYKVTRTTINDIVKKRSWRYI